MKKLPICLLLLIAAISLSGQITLEQSYAHSGNLTELSDGEFKYFMMDVPLKQVRLYNEDHSLYKTISLTIPSGYYLYDVKFVSRNIFNQDVNIELLYIYQKYEPIDGVDAYSYGLRVISEGGTMLLTLDNGGFAEILEGSDGPKLLAYQYIFYDTYYLVYTNVYKLGGELKSADKQTFSSLKLYPNPVNEELTINAPPGTGTVIINITDLAGRKVISENYETQGGRVSIPVNSLPAGTYLVTLHEDSGEMSSGKFEKK